MLRRFRGELFQGLPKHPVERWEWVNDVGERFQRRAQLDRQHELADYLPRARRDQGRAYQHAARAIGDQFESASVKRLIPLGGRACAWVSNGGAPRS